MAAHAAGDPVPLSVSFSDDESLCDEQIQALLRGAEGRLRQNSSLQPKPLTQESTTLPMFNVDPIILPCIGFTKGAARVDPLYLRKQQDRGLAERIRTVETLSDRKQRLKQEKQATAGPGWFHLSRTNLTPELKRDLQLLNLRSSLDPRRHYKKQNSKAELPAFSQVGTIIQSPAEYYSARLPNKQRKKTLVEEVLAGEAENHRFRRAYAKVQAVKTSGKKASYKVGKAKRLGRS